MWVKLKSKEENNEAKLILDKITTENFPKLMNGINPQTQEV
jgi:hypothetical protein